MVLIIFIMLLGRCEVQISKWPWLFSDCKGHHGKDLWVLLHLVALEFFFTFVFFFISFRYMKQGND